MNIEARTLTEETQPGYPALPSTNDNRWQQMRVMANSRNASPLCSLPRLKLNYPLTTVYDGDVVSVMCEVRHGTWVAVKIDYLTGWINTLHLDLVPYNAEDGQLGNCSCAQADHKNPQIDAAKEGTDEFADQMRELDETAEKAKTVTFTLTTSEVNRVIAYMRGIARTLRNARDE